MLCGCITAYGMGSLHIWNGSIKTEKYIRGLQQHIVSFMQCLLSGKVLHISARPCMHFMINGQDKMHFGSYKLVLTCFLVSSFMQPKIFIN